MASKTEICNLAIAHLGIGKEISNLSTDRSQEGIACRRFYDTVRDMTLKKYPWPFAKRIVALGLMETYPTLEWGYSYRYPSDCLVVRRLLTGETNTGIGTTRLIYSDAEDESFSYEAQFVLGSDDQGQLIYTNLENAEIEYTKRVEEAAHYTSDFTIAFSMLLASFIAPTLTSGDDFKKASEQLQKAMSFFDFAQTTVSNEQRAAPLRESEFIRIRG